MIHRVTHRFLCSAREALAPLMLRGRSSVGTASLKNCTRRPRLRCRRTAHVEHRINFSRALHPSVYVLSFSLVSTRRPSSRPHAPSATPLTNCNIEGVTSPPGAHSFPRQKAKLFDDDGQQKVPPPNEARQVPQLRSRLHGRQPSPPAGASQVPRCLHANESTA